MIWIFVLETHINTRKEAIGAGLLAGPIAMIPAIFFFIAMMGYYPEIVDQSLPVNFLLNILDVPVFMVVFQIILFGTFIETSTAMIHSFNARIAVTIENTHFKPHEQCIAQLDAHLQFFILNYSGYKGI